jgi:hypothetical protein
MVLWCKCCGALIGLREPVRYWYVDRWAICRSCSREQEAAQATKLEVFKNAPPPIIAARDSRVDSADD